MKLTVTENPQVAEPRVTVEYATLDGEVEAILRALNAVGRELLGKRGKELVRVPTADVLYCESVDGIAFLYTEDTVIESPLRLSEIDESLRNTSFVRISRNLIANLDHVSALRPFPNARLQLLMDNGEYVTSSRQYAPDVKRKLGL